MAVGDEQEDEDEIYKEAMLYGRIVMARGEMDRVLFTATEVIFDTAADSSLFQNSDLLTDITMRGRPLLIGGVQQDGQGLRVENEGTFRDLGTVSIAPGAAANILAGAEMVDSGFAVNYDPVDDAFTVEGTHNLYRFARKLRTDGSRYRFYTCDFAELALVTTVAENLRRYTAREVKQMALAEQLMQRLGHMTSNATMSLLNAGVQNCPVTATDVRNKDAAKGVSVPGLLGKTKKRASAKAGYVLAPRVVQVQQILHIDIIFVKKVPFLLGVMTPLALGLTEYLKNRGEDCVRAAIDRFLAVAASRDFQVREIRCDGEGSVSALVHELNAQGMPVMIAGPGQHVPVAERWACTVKSRFRCHELSLPFVMTLKLIIWCMRFCTHSVNLQRSATFTDNVSPFEQFSGMKLDAKRDLRVAFGDFVYATVPNTDNSMNPRTEPCIALGGKLNLTGTVWMLNLKTGMIVARDQFVISPWPDHLLQRVTTQALRQGYTRGADPTLEAPTLLDEDEPAEPVPLPEMMPIDGRADALDLNVPGAMADGGPGIEPADQLPGPGVIAAWPEAAVDVEAADDAAEPIAARLEAAVDVEVAEQDPPLHLPTLPPAPHADFQQFGVRWSQRLGVRTPAGVLLARYQGDADRAEIRRQLLLRHHWRDAAFVFKIAVRAALRERGEEARAVIMAELRQMVHKKVWHGVHMASLTPAERRAVIRSSMFLKDKFLASGAFEKFKARLVAGGDQQDHGLYENLSSPTAATTSVLSIAAIAAAERRRVVVMDIGGAFLNADISGTGVKVFMRLDRIMTRMLVEICPEHKVFVEENGMSVVQLDKALYGCIEAAALWFADLRAALVRDGFRPNPYDECVFNKFGADGNQITVVVHIDDLFVSSTSAENLTSFEKFMRSTYAEIKVNTGDVLDYLGMTFDFRMPGQVAVTMDNCVQDILVGCGVSSPRATPATATLFDTRDAPKASPEDVKFFRTYVAKLLYLSKRVKPECLVAVAFLTTRVHEVDIDDLAKLRRVLGYLRATQHRGIVLRVGENMAVKAYIDAAYGVHKSSGRSHTGCAIVLGEAGVLSARSSKQKIVTKSSTEAELVGLSDSAAQAIHLRNFVHEQGYDVGPAVIYQDNLSCMALMKRGGPGSERSRHINIRHFWVSEKVAEGEVVIEHLSTELMHANALTKPVQGAQFERERQGLTNWE